MARWEIRCFQGDRGRPEFCDAYADQPARARAEFRATLNGLRDQPTVEGWSRANGFDLLNGKKYAKYRGIGKLRFQASGVQHRPLGFLGPRPGMFTLLIWATERDGEFHPPGVLDRALSRMNRVLRNPELADECDL